MSYQSTMIRLPSSLLGLLDFFKHSQGPDTCSSLYIKQLPPLLLSMALIIQVAPLRGSLWPHFLKYPLRHTLSHSFTFFIACLLPEGRIISSLSSLSPQKCKLHKAGPCLAYLSLYVQWLEQWMAHSRWLISLAQLMRCIELRQEWDRSGEKRKMLWEIDNEFGFVNAESWGSPWTMQV